MAYGGTLFRSVEIAARDGGEIGWTAAPRPHLEEPAKRASRRTLQEASSCPLERPSRRDACGAAPRDEAAGANGGHAERYGRPEFPLQTVEKVDSAPGIALDPQFSTVATGWNLLRDATLCVAPQHEGGERLSAAAAADNRPEILLQTIEKVDSAPGVSTPPETIGGADAAQPGTRAAALDKVRRDAPPADNRPEIPAQTIEKVDSAPRIAPDPQFSTVAIGWTLLRDATLCVAAQHQGGERPSAAVAAEDRPEILLQTLEKVDSAPGEIEPSRRRRTPSPSLGSRPGDRGKNGRPGRQISGRRSPAGAWAITGGRPWGALCRLSSRYPTTCIVSHIAASAGLCRPSISTLTS